MTHPLGFLHFHFFIFVANFKKTGGSGDSGRKIVAVLEVAKRDTSVGI